MIGWGKEAVRLDLNDSNSRICGHEGINIPRSYRQVENESIPHSNARQQLVPRIRVNLPTKWMSETKSSNHTIKIWNPYRIISLLMDHTPEGYDPSIVNASKVSMGNTCVNRQG